MICWWEKFNVSIKKYTHLNQIQSSFGAREIREIKTCAYFHSCFNFQTFLHESRKTFLHETLTNSIIYAIGNILFLRENPTWNFEQTICEHKMQFLNQISPSFNACRNKCVFSFVIQSCSLDHFTTHVSNNLFQCTLHYSEYMLSQSWLFGIGRWKWRFDHNITTKRRFAEDGM